MKRVFFFSLIKTIQKKLRRQSSQGRELGKRKKIKQKKINKQTNKNPTKTNNSNKKYDNEKIDKYEKLQGLPSVRLWGF